MISVNSGNRRKYRVQQYPKERQLGRLKQFTHYFAGTYTFGHHLATAVQTSSSMEQAAERAGYFFEKSVY